MGCKGGILDTAFGSKHKMVVLVSQICLLHERGGADGNRWLGGILAVKVNRRCRWRDS